MIPRGARPQADREQEQYRQKLQLLLGERGHNPALRLDQVKRLSMQSTPVTGTPTADEYNALRNDIEALYRALNSVGGGV
jgi:hypothetical protein